MFAKNNWVIVKCEKLVDPLVAHGACPFEIAHFVNIEPTIMKPHERHEIMRRPQKPYL